jgi:hypothetical protein
MCTYCPQKRYKPIRKASLLLLNKNRNAFSYYKLPYGTDIFVKAEYLKPLPRYR